VPRILLIALVIPLSAQMRLATEGERGRQIYERGTSPSGSSIEAFIAGDSKVPGPVVPCMNCHGRDGLGRPEGGVAPSDITWEALTKPYAVTHSDGRTHPAYTEHLLKRAITMGVDSAGNPLNPAMPRYQLSLADASDLVAYIKGLGRAADPGVTGSAVRLGVILPAPSRNGTGNAMRRAFLDYFVGVNAGGGIFGRRIELTFVELPTDSAKRSGAVRDFLRSEQVFALTGDFTGAESEIAGILRETGTPGIAALAPFPEAGSPPNPYVFYLDGGVIGEADALIGFLSERAPAKDRRIAIVSCEEEVPRAAAKWLQARLARDGHLHVAIYEDVTVTGADFVFWLRPDVGGVQALVDANPNSLVLVPGSLVRSTSGIPPDSRVYFALGAAARQVSDRAAASAAILAEAMRLAGRGLSRGTILMAIESPQDMQAGLREPISFGRSRRIGSSKVQIVSSEKLR
jgi:ABC-type branched-subunit amino acid transport system substrate-binding protein